MLCLFTLENQGDLLGGADAVEGGGSLATVLRPRIIWIAARTNACHADANDEVLLHLRTLALAAGVKLQTFLEGLPLPLSTHASRG